MPLVASALCASPSGADSVPPSLAGRIGSGLARRIEQRPRDPVVAWVFFTDRAGREHDPAAFEAARRALSARALDRRARRGLLRDLTSSDLPVHEPYVRALVARGARLRGTSRWLDAASVELPASLALEIARLPFVARVELVPLARRMTPVEEAPAAPVSEPEHGNAAVPVNALLAPGETAYYGATFRQLSMIQVPQLHALGLTGAGVVVCILDGGFHITHQAFAGLHVIAKRDFIHGDSIVDNEAGQDAANENTHGTETLGCLAAVKPGTYASPAFGASVALGKTEEVPTENPVEMDYWQFGAEWADSLGADIISTSLGYNTFDNSADDYTYADMDGRTTVVTLAAAEAARRGIAVVAGAGNEAALPWHYIIAPADADSIVTVGAVDSFNVVTTFSSRGPTADGRIKPDVTAMGRFVYVVSPGNDASYTRVSGTSFSTPLSAGLAALLLEAHPTWTPVQLREALRETALNHAAPNNDIGWGLVQGVDARAFDPTPTAVGRTAPADSRLTLAAGPNPARGGSGVQVRLAAPSASIVTVEVFDLAGRRRARLYHGPASGPLALHWGGADDAGATLADGVYWIRAAARGAVEEVRAVRIALIH